MQTTSYIEYNIILAGYSKTRILKHTPFLCKFYELRKLNTHTGVEGYVFVAWFGQYTDIAFLVSLFGFTQPIQDKTHLDLLLVDFEVRHGQFEFDVFVLPNVFKDLANSARDDATGFRNLESFLAAAEPCIVGAKVRAHRVRLARPSLVVVLSNGIQAQQKKKRK